VTQKVMEIMKFNKFVKRYILRESVKEMELNRILDKISKKKVLDNRESNFLNLYNTTTDDDMKDYMFMSKNTTFDKIKKLLSNGKVVICDIHDRNGKIGLKIKSIENNFENEKCDMTMTNDEKYSLEDRFLYNLVFNQKRGEYSLQTQDEFYEKIPVKN
jgi:hypothetical protein